MLGWEKEMKKRSRSEMASGRCKKEVSNINHHRHLIIIIIIIMFMCRGGNERGNGMKGGNGVGLLLQEMKTECAMPLFFANERASWPPPR